MLEDTDETGLPFFASELRVVLSVFIFSVSDFSILDSFEIFLSLARFSFKSTVSIDRFSVTSSCLVSISGFVCTLAFSPDRLSSLSEISKSFSSSPNVSQAISVAI